MSYLKFIIILKLMPLYLYFIKLQSLLFEFGLNNLFKLLYAVSPSYLCDNIIVCIYEILIIYC